MIYIGNPYVGSYVGSRIVIIAEFLAGFSVGFYEILRKIFPIGKSLG